MAIEIGISFSPIGTVSSTFTSLVSLAKQVRLQVGKVISIELNNFRLQVQLDNYSSGNTKFNVTQKENRFEVSLDGLSTDALGAALIDLANKLSSEQIRQGAILDVQALRLEGMKLSVELVKSNFLVKSTNLPFIEETVREAHSNPAKEVMASSNRLLLIDASNLINSCYFATAHGKEEKDLMKSSAGVYTNAIKALIDRFISIVRIYAPTHIAIARDEKREFLHRRQNIFSGYKQNRDNKERPQSLTDQIELAYRLFEAMNLPQFKVDRMEADDVIGHFAKRFVEENRGDVIILSNDKDLFQLLNGKVTQVLSQNIEMTRESFLSKYDGITPEQFADFKALCGEEGDNIPGVPGVGEKTAIKLLKEFETLDNVLLSTENIKGKLREKIEEFADDARMSKQLAMLYTDLPQLQSINFNSLLMKIDKEGMRKVLEELEININRASVA